MRCSLAVMSALCAAACVVDPQVDGEIDEAIDDAIEEDEADKADSVGAYRHYLLWADPGEDAPRHVARAGGGKLRCPDDVVREVCELDLGDVTVTRGLDLDPGVLHDELADHGVIVRGRIVRGAGAVTLRASAVTRGLTGVTPSGTCYRLRRRSDTFFDLEQLDRSIIERRPVLYFDDVDPTPDFWGQPTPAVQAQLDDALRLAASRPVFACGWMDRRDTGDLFWANQVFAPR